MKENRKEKKRKICGWPELGGLAEVLPPPEVLVVLTAVEKERKMRTVICFQIVSRVIF